MARPFHEAQVNYYVQDVEGMAAFYQEHFGFVETFRFPREGAPLKIEVRLGEFVLGFGAVAAVRALHGLDVDPGRPRGEIALWTDDVDRVHAELTARGVRCLSPPHNFVDTLRAAWFEDPEGNPIQIVSRVGAGHDGLPAR
ncbi:MAG TPA: VOC family protein [Bacillota bacterium]